MVVVLQLGGEIAGLGYFIAIEPSGVEGGGHQRADEPLEVHGGGFFAERLAKGIGHAADRFFMGFAHGGVINRLTRESCM